MKIAAECRWLLCDATFGGSEIRVDRFPVQRVFAGEACPRRPDPNAQECDAGGAGPQPVDAHVADRGYLESAILATLNPELYTGIVKGKNNTSGVALVEVYDLNQTAASKLGNISTRAFVSTGANIMIAGFILGNHPGADNVILRGIGPSLTAFGVPNALANPTLELRNGNGALIRRMTTGRITRPKPRSLARRV